MEGRAFQVRTMAKKVTGYSLWKLESGWVWLEWNACQRGGWGQWVVRAEINGRQLERWNISFYAVWAHVHCLPFWYNGWAIGAPIQHTAPAFPVHALPPSSSCPALAAQKLHELHFVFLFAVMYSQHLDNSQGKESTQSIVAE